MASQGSSVTSYTEPRVNRAPGAVFRAIASSDGEVSIANVSYPASTRARVEIPAPQPTCHPAHGYARCAQALDHRWHGAVCQTAERDRLDICEVLLIERHPRDPMFAVPSYPIWPCLGGDRARPQWWA